MTDLGGTPFVVSSLPEPRVPYPYSSVAQSPSDRRYAVLSGNDSLQVISLHPITGKVEQLRSLRVSHYFHSPSTAVPSNNDPSSRGALAVKSPGSLPVTTGQVQLMDAPNSGHRKKYGDVRDTFGLHRAGTTVAAAAGMNDANAAAAGGGVSVTITDVAWSYPQNAAKETMPSLDDDGVVHMSSGGASRSMALGVSDNPVFITGSSDNMYGGGLDNGWPRGQHFSSQNTTPATSSGVPWTNRPDSVVAAAGSNGTVVIWHARDILLGATSYSTSPTSLSRRSSRKISYQSQRVPFSKNEKSSSGASPVVPADASITGQPEAVLGGHSRAVNRLAFSPRKPSLLLTASQDSTVKLWDRRISASPNEKDRPAPKPAPFGHDASPAHRPQSSGGAGIRSWFNVMTQNFSSSPDTAVRVGNLLPSWCCVSTFQPKSEAVRDVQWNPHFDDAFAMVTDSGYLVVYDIRVVARPVIKIAAHSGEATSVDWHPTKEYVVATGGGRDRSVKVWNCENSLVATTKSDVRGGFPNLASNSLSNRSDRSEGSSGGASGSARSAEDGVITGPGCVYRIDSNQTLPSMNVHTFGSTNSGLSASCHATAPATNAPHLEGTIKRSVSEFRHMTSRSFSVATGHSSQRPLPKKGPINHVYTLSVLSPVTRLRWRPPSGTSGVLGTANSSSTRRAEYDQISKAGSSDSTVDTVDFSFGTDRHDAMLAVATAPISGTSAGGGYGTVGLWSCLRPYMPLSVVEGHIDGAVVDFFWVDTPPPLLEEEPPEKSDGPITSRWMSEELRTGEQEEKRQVPLREDLKSARSTLKSTNPTSADFGRQRGGGYLLLNGRYVSTATLRRLKVAGSPWQPIDLSLTRKLGEEGGHGQETSNDWLEKVPIVGTWQHILSVGRDGRCLLQSLARGLRPIQQTPLSALAVSTLSPFRNLTGSLQIVSVHQHVPSEKRNDFWLTGLRCDSGTNRAPGVFREVPKPGSAAPASSNQCSALWGKRVPTKAAPLLISTLGSPSLKLMQCRSGAVRAEEVNACTEGATLAPELLHLSVFAKCYRLRCDESLSTRSSLCLHNAGIADNVKPPASSTARMWRILAGLLQGGGRSVDCPSCEKTGRNSADQRMNAISFVLWPALKSLLIERADAGDVQTCVALCEVVGLIVPPRGMSSKTSSEKSQDVALKVPGLDVQLVREWYLSYVDILHCACLFGQSADLIRKCHDPVISALNRNSTTIHECCPFCSKPLHGARARDEYSASSRNDGGNQTRILAAQRACGNCRNRVGLCFLCREPVRSMFVWCPGCGHGGHLGCARNWFGGENEQMVQDACPSGCGHKCNFARSANSLRTVLMPR